MTDSLTTITRVSVSSASTLTVQFSDGATGEVDLSALIARATPMTAPLSDPSFFARVFLEQGAPTWPNGFDLAPWAIYEDLKRAGRLHQPGRSA
ncbi:DUF2442 domain-containing protein [Maricaulis sp.]|uniref:DUF2442 domain-containing protein n=1 Tax=Maricaulis sp. TaxID=1486257 RepID=UPI002607BE92|nr:DUF2442 domain-containing protein [Maricaulis sp.]